MKKTVNLPLYNEFLNIFDNHKIHNWQAKDFWEKMDLKHIDQTKKSKIHMYTGLKVLHKCGYLKVDAHTSSRKLFRYNETPKVNELRNRVKKQNLKVIFSSKEEIFMNQIEQKENNINFLNDLLSDNKSLEKYLINYKETLMNEVKNLEDNIRLMNDIMNT